MKIAHIVDCMQVGGAEVLVAQTCRMQRAQGHDPSVYAIGTLGPLGEQLRLDGFRVEADLGHGLPATAWDFYRLFRQLRPDVVHMHNPTPTIYASMAARLAGVPSIVSTRHSLVGRPRRKVVEIKYAVGAAFCDWLVGICQATTANMIEARNGPARKIVRVYNGSTAITPAPREQWPAKDGFTFVFVGRMDVVKNHTLLLRAFHLALASNPELRLWMVGYGWEQPRLEELAAELGILGRITFWGKQLDVAPYFSAADVFIMSSKSEGLPMSLLQALSAGLPIIVTDVGGMGEVVRMAEAGYVVPLGDPAPMAETMLKLAADQAERKRFSSNARRAYEQGFTLETMGEAYMKLYQDTPGARRAAKM
jgi:glycosyltransferase involved in cell wall biosynthesis